MTEKEARKEARRRWSKRSVREGYVRVADPVAAEIYGVLPGNFLVGYTAHATGRLGGHEFSIQGVGESWESAFADADRRLSEWAAANGLSRHIGARTR